MVAKALKEMIKSCDLFAQPVTFRYAHEPEYQSLTGGLTSIVLLIIFLSIFTGNFINTFKKVKIDSKTTYIEEDDPSIYKVGTDSFMFAIGIKGIDLSQGDKWFEVYFEKRIYQGNNRTYLEVPLQKCQKQQWTKIMPEMNSTYDQLGFDQWLCPMPNLEIELQGKYSSDMFKHYKIGVKQCNDSIDPTRKCVDANKIDKFLNAQETFTFNFYFINTIINPSSSKFLDNYLDDRNYFLFTPADGITANLFISSFQVTTDQSIYPNEQLQSVRGGLSTTTTQTISYKVRQSDYLKFYLRKSSLSLELDRNFEKIDDTLSYIGGLFSTILSCLILVGKYNETSYELEIAKNLYHYDKNEPIQAEKFNFFIFLGYLIYAFFQKLGVNLPWPYMRKYHNCMEHVRCEMDIRLMMKKVQYSERTAIAVFDEPKAKILHLQQPLTLFEADQIRKGYRFYEKLEQKYFDYEKIRQEQNLNPNAYSQKETAPKAAELSEYYTVNTPQKQESENNDLSFLPPLTLNKERSSNYRKSYKEQYAEKLEKDEECKKQANLVNIVNFFMGHKTDKEQELKSMIEDMKLCVKVLEEQSERGDITSKKILKRFDPKLMKIFMKEQEEPEIIPKTVPKIRQTLFSGFQSQNSQIRLQFSKDESNAFANPIKKPMPVRFLLPPLDSHQK